MTQQVGLIIGFVLIVGAIIFSSITLAYLVDYLEKKTKLSAAFLSGIVFSMINSFPEFITSMLSCLDVGSNHDSIFSNLMGGNLFILFSLAIVTLIFIKNFNKKNVLLSNVLAIGALIICYLLIAYALFFPYDVQFYISAQGFYKGSNDKHDGFNLMSLFIIIIYVLMFVYSTFIEKKDKEDDGVATLPRWLSKINLKFAVTIFCSLSVALVGISVGLSFIDEQLVAIWFGEENNGFGASLLLGIPTSIPELISIISLCKIKNYNASFQTIIGSSLFSIFTLCLCDAITTKITGWTIYTYNADPIQTVHFWEKDESSLIFWPLLMSVMFVLYLWFCKIKKHKRTAIAVVSSINVLIYAIYLIIGFYLMTTNDSSVLSLFNDAQIPNWSHLHYYHNNFFSHQSLKNLNSYRI